MTLWQLGLRDEAERRMKDTPLPAQAARYVLRKIARRNEPHFEWHRQTLQVRTAGGLD